MKKPKVASKFITDINYVAIFLNQNYSGSKESTDDEVKQSSKVLKRII